MKILLTRGTHMQVNLNSLIAIAEGPLRVTVGRQMDPNACELEFFFFIFFYFFIFLFYFLFFLASSLSIFKFPLKSFKKREREREREREEKLDKLVLSILNI
jgi:hypothetical protein